jgi:protein-tyrosine kinase
MSLIEEAAKRLQHLEQAGITVPLQDPIPQQAVARAAVRPRPPTPQASPHDKRVEPFLPDEIAARRNGCKIDFARLQAAGFITPVLPDSKLLHEFRVIKRPLIQYALGKSASRSPNSNLIMVTSSLPGEGKTFVALNLAMSIAMEVDCTVLLVDADVACPSMPALLSIPPAKGLMDLLVNPEVSFDDVLLRTNVERLALMQAGTPQRGAAELLSSAAMSQLLNEISSRYPDRIVLFDSPPLLAATESRVLAAHMGQVLVVVEAERTTHTVLESALATVQDCPVVLTMLNKAPESESASYYAYNGNGR